MIGVIADCGNCGMGQIGVANRFEQSLLPYPSLPFYFYWYWVSRKGKGRNYGNKNTKGWK